MTKRELCFFVVALLAAALLLALASPVTTALANGQAGPPAAPPVPGRPLSTFTLAPAPSAATDPTNKLANGDFESGFTNGVARYWSSFNNGGETRYSFSAETEAAMIKDGSRGQRVELATVGQGSADPGRYAGIYQVVSGLTEGATYEFSVWGMMSEEAAHNEEDAFRYGVQWGYAAAATGGPGDITKWNDVPWTSIYLHTAPGGMSFFSTRFQAPGSRMVLAIRAWKKWGTTGRVFDVNLDAITLQDGAGVARRMKADGKRATEIASTMQDAFKLDAPGAGQALKSARFDCVETGQALRSAYRVDDHASARILKGVGCTPVETGLALARVYSAGSPGAGQALQAAGFTSDDIGRSLKEVFGLDAAGVARSLKALEFSPLEVGLTLRDVFAADDLTAAPILKSVGFSTLEITRILKDDFANNGLGAVQVLKDVLHLGAVECAAALYSSQGYGLSAPADGAAVLAGAGFGAGDTALALRARDAYNVQDPLQAARVLKGVRYSLLDVAKALKAAGIYNLAEGRAAAPVLKDAGYSETEVATVLKSGEVYAQDATATAATMKGAGYSPLEIGRTLKSAGVFNQDAQAAALVLEHIGYTAPETAQVLRAEDGYRVAQAPEAAGLLSRAGYDEAALAQALRAGDGYNIREPQQAAVILKAIGYAVTQTGRALKAPGGYAQDVQAAARILKAVGYTNVDVAKALKDVYAVANPRRAVDILKATGYAAREVAAALKAGEAYNMADGQAAVAVLKDAGYTEIDIGKALRAADVYAQEATAAAGILKRTGYTPLEIGRTLGAADVYNHDAQAAALVLQHIGCSAVETAGVLRAADGFAVTYAQEGAALLSRAGYGEADVARALQAVEGYDVRDPRQAAEIMRGIGYSALQAGQALQAAGAYGQDAPATTGILKATGYTNVEVARTLKEVYGVRDPREAVRVLKTAGYAARDVGESLKSAVAYDQDVVVAARILAEAGYDARQISTTLSTVFETDRPVNGVPLTRTILACLGLNGPREAGMQPNYATWERVSGPWIADQVAVGNANNVWVITRGGWVFRRTGTAWEQVDGNLKQLSVGCDGTVWGVNPAGQLVQWDQAGWQRADGAGAGVVSAGNTAGMWTVGEDGRITPRTAGNARDASQVSVGCDASALALDGAQGLQGWDGINWTALPQPASPLAQVAVATGDNIWGLSTGRQLLHFSGKTWEQITPDLNQTISRLLRSKLKQVSAGCDGAVWGINTLGELFVPSPQISTTHWMADLRDYIGNKPLAAIVLPGTHASASGPVTSTVAVSATRRAAAQAIEPGLAWTRTQDQPVADQLAGGIRSLELRPCLREGTFMNCQGSVYTADMAAVLGDIAAFAAREPSEILFVRFAGLQALTDGDMARLRALVEARLGDHLIDAARVTPDTTLNELWEGQPGKSVLGIAAGRQMPGFWSKFDDTYATGVYRQADKKKALESSLNRAISHTLSSLAGYVDPARLSTASGQDPYPRDLRAAALQTNRVFLGWVKDTWAAKGLNIIALDFYNHVASERSEDTCFLRTVYALNGVPGVALKDCPLGGKTNWANW